MQKTGDRVIIIDAPTRYVNDDGRRMPLLSKGTIVWGDGEFGLFSIRVTGFTFHGSDEWYMLSREIQVIEEE